MTRPVRTRFGPSLKAPLSLGGLRVALFNYALASAHAGEFVLRIEDVDRRRSRPPLEHELLDLLRWLGVGSAEHGAPVLVRRQSERLGEYRRHAERLVEAGHAYRCFCSPQRLAGLRDAQPPGGRARGYDRRCAVLPEPRAERRAALGEPHVIRMRVPTEPDRVEVHDQVFGAVAVPTSAIDDQVLLKSDGFPTMHLASVVDDHLMGITHVVRASVWLASTPKHLLLASWLGWPPPRFAHVAPVARGPFAPAVAGLRARGVPPAAVVNLAAELGTRWAGTCFTLADLCRGFDLRDLRRTCGPAREERLRRVSRQHLRRQAPRTVAEAAAPFLRARGLPVPSLEYATAAVRVAGPRLTSYASLAADFPYLFADPELDARALGEVAAARDALTALREELSALSPFTAAAIEERLRAQGPGRGPLARAVRWAVAGADHAPGLAAMLALLGRPAVLRRVDAALAHAPDPAEAR
jgi:glutamyl-tRNA synthetase